MKKVKKYLKFFEEGEDVFPHSDGTWSIKVTKWEDAYKVTPEQYAEQVKAVDNIAIDHMDTTVRDTWSQRKWIGENETLNQKNVAKIVNRYKDKFKIDNNIKVEFIDGLADDAEGSTSVTQYLGKNKKKVLPKTKGTQEQIDKKKLQIQKLEDDITMLEGGNKEVSDPLYNLKEKLRIAKNELKKLQEQPTVPEKLPNIIITIDKNARNKDRSGTARVRV